MAITLLDDSLINKIAAGEVIERPASIVKELLENSIDAGSSSITVKIENGGIDLIEVEDDGEGISPEEIPLAFLRHATSKIGREEDLFNIRTMGFRGEALPSIAAVSRVEVYTCRKGKEGFRARIEAGSVVENGVFPCPPGTRIVVQDLFYNTPVRKKFLKTPVTEGRNVNQLLCRYALARPDISFTFYSEKKTYFKTPGNGKLRDALLAVFGSEYARFLLDVNYQGENYSLSGLVSSPEVKRINRSNQVFFVNQRPIRSPLLYKAIDTAYRGLLLSREYPVVILALTVPTDSIDVNVHPQKSEIRFREESTIFKLVNDVVRNVLNSTDYRVPISLEPLEGIYNRPAEPRQVFEEGTVDFSFVDRKNIQPANINLQPDRDNFTSTTDYRIIGQCLDSYVLIEKDDALWMVDQHAAHERILYAKLLEQYNSQTEISQVLALPIELELAAEDVTVLENNQELLNQLGFDISPAGYNTVLIRAVPSLVTGRESAVVADLVDLLKQGDRPDLKNRAIIMMACKKAVKAGARLSLAEMETIIKDLYHTEDYRHCPHGRPTIICFDHSELDKMFKR